MENHKNREDFSFSLIAFLKYRLKKLLNLQINDKELIFENMEDKYKEELNIGILLQRIFILEFKLKILMSDSSYSPISPMSPPILQSIKNSQARSLGIKRKRISVYDILYN